MLADPWVHADGEGTALLGMREPRHRMITPRVVVREVAAIPMELPDPA
jgi:hypothetical protein